MQLSQLIDKNICAGKNTRGICVGVGLSLKSKAVKYLLCSSQPTTQISTAENLNNQVDFAISTTAVKTDV